MLFKVVRCRAPGRGAGLDGGPRHILGCMLDREVKKDSVSSGIDRSRPAEAGGRQLNLVGRRTRQLAEIVSVMEAGGIVAAGG